MRGMTTSPANCAWPRSFSAASRRGAERPTSPARTPGRSTTLTAARPGILVLHRYDRRACCDAKRDAGRPGPSRLHPGELADGLEDPLVPRAAAEVPGEALPDVLDGPELPCRDERLRGEEHARRAEAALESRVARERVLEPGELLALREAFDRQDITAVRVGGQRAARTHRSSVEKNRARSADLHLAGALRAGQAEPVAEQVEEQLTGLDRERARAAVDANRDLHPASDWCDRGGAPMPPSTRPRTRLGT